MKHLPAIDGLRAIAVLAVVAYHAGLPVPAGFVGVDVFFVISGYVITRMLAAEIAATGRVDLLAFYARRVRRILPALLAMVAAVMGAAVVLLTNEGVAGIAHSAKAAIGVTANLYFMNSTGGYFDQAAADMPLLHTWSLSVEEQFYLLWPLLLLLRRKWLMPALVAGSLVFAEWLRHVDAGAAFYQMPARAWELGAGALIAYAAPRPIRWLAPLGLAVLAGAVVYPLPAFPGVGALPAVLGASAVLYAIHGGAVVPVLETRPVRYVGLASYSLYLWHWPVLVFWRLTHIDPPSVPVSLALCLAAGGLAALSYRWVETPFRRLQWPTYRVVGSGVAACLAAIMATSTVAHPRAAAHAPDPALFVPANVAPSMGVWGDSHAGMWRPVIASMAHREHRGALYLDYTACPPVIGDAPVEAGCKRHNERAIQQLQGFDTVLISVRWLALFNTMPRGFEGLYPDDAASVDRMTAGMERAIADLHARRILLVGPVPQLRASAERCLASGAPDRCAMTRSQFEALAAAPRRFMTAMATKYPNVEIIDPEPFLCGNVLCPVSRYGVTLYADDDHISAAAAQAFAIGAVQPAKP
jgi:peptidoglycan/LPS O-acetylase OafA/YrhL